MRFSVRTLAADHRPTAEWSEQGIRDRDELNLVRKGANYGPLRAVAVGPDGAAYVGASNRDGRGFAREGDDRILRIGPAAR